MKNRISKLIICTIAAVLLISGSSYAFQANGEKEGETTNSQNMGTIGTKENPINYVDGTGVEFASWAKGKYFTTDCEYLNITENHDVEIRLVPVYEPNTYTLTVSAGEGKFGTESSVEKEVNFNDKTIDTAKEKTEIDSSKDLGTVLSGLTPEYSGYIPYYYSFGSSTFNKRIFIDKNDAAKTESDDADLETAVYDLKSGGTITLVWKDCADATGWNDSQKAAAKFIAVEGSLTEVQYHTCFGGTETVPYGTITVEKKLPGAVISSFAWKLKKNAVELDSKATAVYSKTGMDSSYDNTKLSSVIAYGSKYTLQSKELELIAYQRPVISGETIE